MKKIILGILFLFTITFAFAVEKQGETQNIEDIKLSQEKLTVFTLDSFNLKSCTIKSGTQVISNGEVIYQETYVFHIDGMSCEEFFFVLMMAL